MLQIWSRYVDIIQSRVHASPTKNLLKSGASQSSVKSLFAKAPSKKKGSSHIIDKETASVNERISTKENTSIKENVVVKKSTTVKESVTAKESPPEEEDLFDEEESDDDIIAVRVMSVVYV